MSLNEIKLISNSLAWPVMTFMFLSLIGSPIINKTTVFLGICYLLFVNYKDTFFIGKQSIKAYALLLLMLFNVVSLSWSVTPSVSLLNVINDLEILLFSLLAAYHARNKDLALSIKLTFMLIVTLLTLYCFAFPGESMTSIGLRSFYNQKNGLGYAAGLSTIIILMTFKKGLIDYLYLFVSAALLVLSLSKTSMALVVVISLCVLVIYWLHEYYKQLTSFTQGFVRMVLKATTPFLYLMIGATVWFRENIADFLIHNIPYDALTGRGLIWATVLTRSRDDLLLGLGRASFWNAGADSEIKQTGIVYQHMGWLDKLVSADGGYVDVIAAIGFVGLGLLLFALLHAFRLNFKMMRTVEWKLYFSLIAFLMLHNITETSFFKFTIATWFIFLLLTFYLVFKQTPTTRKIVNG